MASNATGVLIRKDFGSHLVVDGVLALAEALGDDVEHSAPHEVYGEEPLVMADCIISHSQGERLSKISGASFVH